MAEYDIFISYSRKDTAIADRICEALRRQGITFFIDRQDLSGGMEFPVRLEKAIKSARLMLFLASENSYRSKFTRREIQYAFNMKDDDTVLPYVIDGSDLLRQEGMGLVFSTVNVRRMSDHPIDTTLMRDLCELLHRDYKDRASDAEPGGVRHVARHTPPPAAAARDLPEGMKPSLPSLFSQLFLADEAFGCLAERPMSHGREDSMSLLVSDCLDLLELLFLYGDMPELELRAIDLDGLTQRLMPSNVQRHRLLAQVLQADRQALPPDFGRFYVVTLQQQVLGGTSPFTLVFASPQCREVLSAQDLLFYGVAGQPLFADTPTPLRRRGIAFQQYVLMLLAAMREPTLLYNYVHGETRWESSQRHLRQELMKHGADEFPQMLRHDYVPLADALGAEVALNIGEGRTLPLCMARADGLLADDYRLKATRANPQYVTPQGDARQLPLPLVLTPGGISGAKYLGGSPWEQSTVGRLISTRQSKLAQVPLHQRVLPGTHLRHPYLLADDLLEDRLVLLPASCGKAHVCTDRFFLLSGDGHHFLLPVKPLYFCYFTPDDLQRQLACSVRENPDDTMEVRVTLRLPVGHERQDVILSRSYDEEQVVRMDVMPAVGLWPDYRVAGRQPLHQLACTGLQQPCVAGVLCTDHPWEVLQPQWGKAGNDFFYCTVQQPFDALLLRGRHGAQGLLVPLIGQRGESPQPEARGVGIDVGSTAVRMAVVGDGRTTVMSPIELLKQHTLSLYGGVEDDYPWLTDRQNVRPLADAADPQRHADAMAYARKMAWLLRVQLDDMGLDGPSQVALSLPERLSNAQRHGQRELWAEALGTHFGQCRVRPVGHAQSLMTDAVGRGAHLSEGLMAIDMGHAHTTVALFMCEQDKPLLLADSVPLGSAQLWEYETGWWPMLANMANRELAAQIEQYANRHGLQASMDYALRHHPKLMREVQRIMLTRDHDAVGQRFVLALAAVLWHAASCLKRRQLPPPAVLQLSGQGLQPLSIMLGLTGTEHLAEALLSHFLQMQAMGPLPGGFAVRWQRDVAVTAQGAAVVEAARGLRSSNGPLLSNGLLSLAGSLFGETRPLDPAVGQEHYADVQIDALLQQFQLFLQAMGRFAYDDLPALSRFPLEQLGQQAPEAARRALLSRQHSAPYAPVADSPFFWPLTFE